MSLDREFDVIVVGAGPAGSAATFFLAKSGLDVLLLDKSEFPRDKTCGDALLPRAIEVLKEMDVLAEVESLAQKISEMEFNDPQGKKFEISAKTKAGYANYLLVIPRLKFDDILRRKATEAGAVFASGCQVLGTEQSVDRVVVNAQVGQTPKRFLAKVVLIATGANIGLLRSTGLLKPNAKEPMLAVRAYFENVSGLGDKIQVYFDDDVLPGYGWIFPISKSSANIGIGLKELRSNDAEDSLRSTLGRFLERPDVKKMLAGANQVGPTKSYPLRADFATASIVSGRVIAIGEAAGMVNPLTGDGIDLAMDSGRIAALFLKKWFANPNPNPAELKQYDRILRNQFQRRFRVFGLCNALVKYPFMFRMIFGLLQKSAKANRFAADLLMSQPILKKA
jgi:menaquinone-9 beta-reductase